MGAGSSGNASRKATAEEATKDMGSVVEVDPKVRNDQLEKSLLQDKQRDEATLKLLLLGKPWFKNRHNFFS